MKNLKESLAALVVPEPTPLPKPLFIEVTDYPGSKVVPAPNAARLKGQEYSDRKVYLDAVDKWLREQREVLGPCPGHVFSHDQDGFAYYIRTCVFCGNVDLI